MIEMINLIIVFTFFWLIIFSSFPSASRSSILAQDKPGRYQVTLEGVNAVVEGPWEVAWEVPD